MRLTDTAYIFAFTLFCMTLLGGCGYTVSGGALDATSTTTVDERTLPDGTIERGVTVVERATAEQPENPDDGALAEAGKARAALMGGSQVPDAGAVQKTMTMTWVGMGLIVLGAVALSIRFSNAAFAKIIPWTVPVTVIGVGALFLMWGRVEAWLFWGALIAVVAFALWYFTQNTVRLNLFQQKAAQ